MSRPELGATTFAWMEYANELIAEIERLRLAQTAIKADLEMRCQDLETDNARLQADVRELNGLTVMLNEQIVALKTDVNRARGPESSRL